MAYNYLGNKIFEHKEVRYYSCGKTTSYQYASREECVRYDGAPLFFSVSSNFFGIYYFIYSANYLQHNIPIVRRENKSLAIFPSNTPFGPIRSFYFGFIFGNIL
jgi:hypothetical protein